MGIVGKSDSVVELYHHYDSYRKNREDPLPMA